MASKQTENMAAALPQFAAVYTNADTGHTWHIRRAYVTSQKDIAADLSNSRALSNAEGQINFPSRTKALISQAIRANEACKAAGIVATEKQGGGYGCWKCCDKQGKACFLFVYPNPREAEGGEEKPQAQAAVKAAQKPAQARKPRKPAGADRRAIAAQEAAQKQAADTAAAEAAQEAAGKPQV